MDVSGPKCNGCSGTLTLQRRSGFLIDARQRTRLLGGSGGQEQACGGK
jgi:hypothetical protein